MSSHDSTHLPKQTEDPHPAGAQRFIGRAVSFDHPVGEPAPKRLCGVVESARYIGRTARGQIPDYEIVIRGKSGAALTTSLVESKSSLT
jgi:hypothetical protein